MADYEQIARRLLQQPTEIPAGERITSQTLVRDPMYNDPAPPRGAAVMKPWEPKYITDNVAPMVSDAASALGVPSTVANRLGREVGTATSWSPPGAFVDAAGDIGGALNRGDARDAILKAGMWNAARAIGGPVYRGAASLLPTAARRDAMQAAYRETLPGMSATPSGYMPAHPTNGNRFMSRVSSFDGRMPAPRNTNDRVNMRPKLGVVE